MDGKVICKRESETVLKVLKPQWIYWMAGYVGYLPKGGQDERPCLKKRKAKVKPFLNVIKDQSIDYIWMARLSAIG